jgi:hypothetical protein
MEKEVLDTLNLPRSYTELIYLMKKMVCNWIAQIISPINGLR